MSERHKILFVNAGASFTGAPILFLNMLGWLKQNSSIDPYILTSGSGPLESKYRELAPVYKWDGVEEPPYLSRFYLYRLFIRVVKKIVPVKEKTYGEKLLQTLEAGNFDLIYANSVSSFDILKELTPNLHCKVICHVRELEISISQFCGIELFRKEIPSIDLFIADSESVRQNLILNHDIQPERVVTVYEYIKISDAEKILESGIDEFKKGFKITAGIPEDAFVVASCGTTDWRKGADLVVHIAGKVVSKTTSPVHFIWIGGEKSGLEFEKLYYDLVKTDLHRIVHFLGVKEKPLEYLVNSDVFMLCSREEPVGIVALEAASLKKPILCFDQAGGMPEFVEDDCGFILPYMDLDSMADHIILLMNDRPLLQKLGANAALKVQRHDINIACREIESIINSVIKS